MRESRKCRPNRTQARALEQGQADWGEAAAPAKARLVDPATSSKSRHRRCINQPATFSTVSAMRPDIGASILRSEVFLAHSRRLAQDRHYTLILKTILPLGCRQEDPAAFHAPSEHRRAGRMAPTLVISWPASIISATRTRCGVVTLTRKNMA